MVKRTSIFSVTDTRYVWSGVLISEEDKSEVGEATFLVDENGEVTGNIEIEGTFYELRSLDKTGMHALIKLNLEHINQNTNDVVNIKTSSAKNVDPQTGIINAPITTQSGPRCSPEMQSVMVLYTAAAAYGKDINSLIYLAIQEMNESYSESQVTNLRMQLAHAQQINFSETNDVEFDLNRFSSDSYVQNLRDQYQADLVILLTGSYYNNIAGVASGIYPGSNNAYALVVADYATAGHFTLAHEVGHLQGAQHHPMDPIDPNGPFAYGFGHRFMYRSGFLGMVKNYRATIMAYTWDETGNTSFSKVKRLSNPNVFYRGKGTGISNERENYKVLKETASTIADYRNPNELRATVSITAYPTQFSNVVFNANVCGGSGSYSYAWKITQDPFNYGSIQSTSQTFSPVLTPGVWYTKLTASTSTGQQAVAFSGVHVLADCDDPHQIFCEEPLLKVEAAHVEGDNSEVGLLDSYPNPFNPTTQVSFALVQPEEVKLNGISNVF
ncbi:MAG: M12 family metallo-peptidase [Balneolaceae bacterium]